MLHHSALLLTLKPSWNILLVFSIPDSKIYMSHALTAPACRAYPPYVRADSFKYLLHFIKLFTYFICFRRYYFIRPERSDPPEPGSIRHKVLAPTLCADHKLNRNHMIFCDPILFPIDRLKRDAPFLPDGREQYTENLTVHSSGNVMVLKSKVILMTFCFIQKK